MSDRPYTPECLAERWGISERQVRRMLNDGRLKGFKVGDKLWRISAEEVARIEGGEKCLKSSSDDTEENTAQFGLMTEEIATDRLLDRIVDKLRT